MRVRAQDLNDLAVINVDQAVKVGTVDDVVPNPLTQQIVALIIKPVASGQPAWKLPMQQIHRIGPDAVTIPESAVNAGVGKELDELLSGDQLRKVKVVTDSGKHLGELDELVIDTETGNIVEYQLSGNLLDRLTQHPHRILPHLVRSYSHQLMIVDDEAGNAPEHHDAASQATTTMPAQPLSEQPTEPVPTTAAPAESSAVLAGESVSPVIQPVEPILMPPPEPPEAMRQIGSNPEQSAQTMSQEPHLAPDTTKLPEERA